MTGDVGNVVGLGQDVIIVGLVYVIEWISSNNQLVKAEGRGQRTLQSLGESKWQPWWSSTVGRGRLDAPKPQPCDGRRRCGGVDTA